MSHVDSSDDLSGVRIDDAYFVTVLTHHVEQMPVWRKRHLNGRQIMLFHGRAARRVGSGFCRDGEQGDGEDAHKLGWLPEGGRGDPEFRGTHRHYGSSTVSTRSATTFSRTCS